MTRTEQVKRRILLDSDMDYAGICPSAVLEDEPRGRRPSDLLPNAKSILVFGRKLISGSVQTKFRQFEDGVMNVSGSYSAHSFVLSVNHLCMNETYNIAQDLENTYGCFAMPLTNNVLQAVQPEGNYAPFFADPMKAGLPLDIYKAAVAAGIGEMGWNHRIITPEGDGGGMACRGGKLQGGKTGRERLRRRLLRLPAGNESHVRKPHQRASLRGRAGSGPEKAVRRPRLPDPGPPAHVPLRALPDLLPRGEF